MLDLMLCLRPVSQWLTLKAKLSDWLASPILVVVPLAIAVLLPWLLPKLRWKRQLMTIASIVLVTYFITTSPLSISVAAKGLVSFLPQDPGTTVDAIVVLGRGNLFTPSRVEVAAKLWEEHRAPLIFASGIGDAGNIVEQLKGRGIPNQALAYEECSRTTEENARFTANTLQLQGVKRILLVTDPYHMLRSLLTFRHVGFKVIPHFSPIPLDLSPKDKALMVFYEYLALVSYGLKGRFFSI